MIWWVICKKIKFHGIILHPFLDIDIDVWRILLFVCAVIVIFWGDLTDHKSQWVRDQYWVLGEICRVCKLDLDTGWISCRYIWNGQLCSIFFGWFVSDISSLFFIFLCLTLVYKETIYHCCKIKFSILLFLTWKFFYCEKKKKNMSNYGVLKIIQT